MLAANWRRRTGLVVVSDFDEVVAGALSTDRVLEAQVAEGELYVVATRHLYYPAALDAPFSTVWIAG